MREQSLQIRSRRRWSRRRIETMDKESRSERTTTTSWSQAYHLLIWLHTFKKSLLQRQRGREKGLLKWAEQGLGFNYYLFKNLENLVNTDRDRDCCNISICICVLLSDEAKGGSEKPLFFFYIDFLKLNYLK